MIGLGRIRVESFMPVLKAESMHVDWLGELSSIRRLHQGFGANALNELFLLCDTQIAEAAGDFEKARQALLEIQRTDAASRCGMSVELLSLEIEWCRIKACAVGISVLPDLPNLDAIRLMKFDEQVVALRFIEDIYAYSGIEIDRLRIDAMRQRAIEKCLDIDKAALSALSVSQNYLNSTKRRVKGLSSETEFD